MRERRRFHAANLMNKLDVSTHTFTASPASHANPSTGFASGTHPEPAPRLIVLFPASETDTPDLDHRIWEIARSSKLNVIILSLSNDYGNEQQLRRKLVTMAAIIKDPYVSTDVMIEHGNDWVKQVRKVWRTGDIVACYAGQKVGLMRKPLDQILRSNLETPVYILSDYRPTRGINSTFISNASAWLGSVSIMGGFLWVEVKIIELPHEWTHNALIYVCIVVEIFLVWLWNLLFT
jgi:hypothetical protein